MSSGCGFPALVLVFFCSLPLLASANTARLSVAGASYKGKIARFGNPIDDGFLRSGILLLPAQEDKELCSFPETLLNATVEYPNPVALLVSLGGCNPRVKAEVALSLNQNFSSQIKYIFMSNTDSRNFDGVPPLRLENTELDPSLFDDMTFLSLSTATGASIQADIWDEVSSTGESPFLSPAGIGTWDMWFGLRSTPINDPPRVPRNAEDDRGVTFFYLIRFVLFGLFIVAPCLRMAYLWRAGGGTISLRRNEQGRINGILYIRPEAYWFVSSASRSRPDERHQAEARSGLLTEEQVLALPEISFQEQPVDEEMATNGRATSSAQSEQSPEGHSGSSAHAGEECTSSSTTCSICIEDFEVGERIRVLPRCGHAYHTECLMPWLTERQGCCPLCKEDVLDRQDMEPPEADPQPEGEHSEEQDGSQSRQDAAQSPPPIRL